MERGIFRMIKIKIPQIKPINWIIIINTTITFLYLYILINNFIKTNKKNQLNKTNKIILISFNYKW